MAPTASDRFRLNRSGSGSFVDWRALADNAALVWFVGTDDGVYKSDDTTGVISSRWDVVMATADADAIDAGVSVGDMVNFVLSEDADASYTAADTSCAHSDVGHSHRAGGSFPPYCVGRHLSSWSTRTRPGDRRHHRDDLG